MPKRGIAHEERAPPEPVQLERFRSFMEEAGAEDSVSETLGVFMQEVPHRVSRLLVAIEQENPGEVEAGAHALRSASLNVWAVELARILERLEDAGARGDGREALRWAGPLTDEVERVMEYLGREIA